MNDEQNEQNEQKKINDLNPYEKLDAFGRNIVDLKLEGWKYKRLEPIAQAKEGTLRQWFMRGGKYHDAFEWRRDQLIKEALEEFSEAEFHLKQGVADAIVVLKAEVAKKNWKAAVALLKMVGFNVQKIISDEESEGTVLLRELIKLRRNEKHKRPGKSVQNRKSKNRVLPKSEKDI
ncbi:MAG: hypothetical protein ACR2LN_02385 [Candidatus Levyibacteriota bacterium]